MDKDQLELFNAWFYRVKHRAKYTDDHPAYLAAQEAWEAWLDAPDTPPRQSRSDVKPLTEEMVKAADRLGLGYTERGYFNDGWCEAEAAHGIYAPSELKENE